MKKISLKSFLEDRIFLFFCVFFACNFFYLSQSSAWVETEIFPVHSSKYLFTRFQADFLFSLKPLFYFLLKLSSLVSEALNTLPMSSARSLFAFNGLGIMVLMYQYIKQKTNPYHAILAVLILAGSYVFLERGFRVRSDLLSSFISLLVLVINLKLKTAKKHYWVLGLLFSLFFITPKSIYWFSLTLLLLFKDSQKVSLAPYILKSLGVFCCVFVLLSFVFQDPLFLKSLQQSFLFFKQSAQNNWGYLIKEGLLATLYDRSHIGSFIENNLFLVLLILANILFLLPGFQKLKSSLSKAPPTESSPAEISPAELSLAQTASTEISSAQTKGKKEGAFNGIFLVLLFIALFHPQQKMFFLCSLMPFFILLFFTHPKWFLNFEAHTRPKFKIAVLIFALSCSGFSIANFHQYSTKNFIQKSLLSHWNSFYKKTKVPVKIFDPLCLIYSIKTDCKYLNSSINIKKYIKDNSFDIIIPSYAVPDFEILSLKLNSFEYVLLKNKIYYKAYILDFKNQPQLYTSYLKSRTGFSGKKIFKDFLNSAPYKTKKYFYLYISSNNRPLPFQQVKDCPSSSNSKRLQAGCYYTKTEIQSGVLPAKKEKLALFYIGLPDSLKFKDSLRYLFKYDHPSY